MGRPKGAKNKKSKKESSYKEIYPQRKPELIQTEYANLCAQIGEHAFRIHAMRNVDLPKLEAARDMLSNSVMPLVEEMAASKTYWEKNEK